MEAEEFLNCGGDSRWLNFTDAPEKLKALSNLNKVMAHRPWLLNKQMVQDLVSRTGDNSRSWCLSELVHVIVILSHFHSLSSFIYATGIEETECVCPQSQGGFFIRDAEKVAKVEEPEDKLIQERVQYLMNQMKSLSERERDEDWADDPEERNKRFVAVMETEESAPGSPPSGPSSLVAAPAAASPPSSPAAAAAVRCATPTADAFSNVDGEERSVAAGCRRPATSAAVGSAGAAVTRIPVKKGSEALAKFLTDPEYVYQDFVSRYQAAVCPTLRIQDCSWEDQGFSLLSRLYSETSSVLLDDKHRTAYNLTYNTLSTIPNVDTSKFRRAVWNYILCLYGIRHDDYNYQEVNQLLQRELKTFIKRACCYPERLSGKDLRCAMKELQYSEKVHVLLMVMEARMEAELLYALRAVMQHLT